jgi:hypothetical protein
VRLLICAILSSVGHVCILGAQPVSRPVSTCDTISNARSGEGVAYRGVVNNDDYRFTATIPEGLTGWGAAPDAPFHGFTIFLDPDRSACIHFTIGIHVDLPEDVSAQPGKLDRAANIKVGNRTGTQTRRSGSVGATRFDNITVKVDLPRGGYRNEVTITLVTPAKESAHAMKVLDRFLLEIRFR